MHFDLDSGRTNTQKNLEHRHPASADATLAAQSSASLGDIVRMARALTKTGMKRTSFLNLQDPKSPYFDPTFPKKIKLGARSVGYSETQLNAWLLSRQISQNGLQSSRVDTIFNYGIPIQPKSTSTFAQASTTIKNGGVK